MGVARVGVDFGSEVVVALGGAPVALLVFVDKLCLAVAGEIAEVDQGLVAGLEDVVPEGGGDARARRRLGCWSRVSSRRGGVVRRRTMVLPLLGNAVQLWDAVDVGIEVQDVLAVVALAGLDEVEVVFLEFADLDDMVLGALELCRVSVRSWRGQRCGATHQPMLLPEDGVDLEVRRPQLLLDVVGGGMCKIGKGQALAGGAVPGKRQRASQRGVAAAHSWRTAASSAHDAWASARR